MRDHRRMCMSGYTCRMPVSTSVSEYVSVPLLYGKGAKGLWEAHYPLLQGPGPYSRPFGSIRQSDAAWSGVLAGFTCSWGSWTFREA